MSDDSKGQDNESGESSGSKDSKPEPKPKPKPSPPPPSAYGEPRLDSWDGKGAEKKQKD